MKSVADISVIGKVIIVANVNASFSSKMLKKEEIFCAKRAQQRQKIETGDNVNEQKCGIRKLRCEIQAVFLFHSTPMPAE